TDEIAKQFVGRGVVFLRQEPRNGKTTALNLAVSQAHGEIIVFADANSFYDRAAIRDLVANFGDPAVGYVTGTLAYLGSDGSMTAGGCSVYMKYENFILRCETLVGSVVGVNGGIDAVRHSLYRPMNADDLPDFVLPLHVVKQGCRVVYEPGAILAETALGTPRDEYRMRVRVALRALWTLAEMAGLLNVCRHGLYSVQLLSHKVLRYLAFVFVLLLYGSSLFLWNAGTFYRFALLFQTLGIASALVGFWAAQQGASSRVLILPYYFALVNFAAFHASLKFLKRERPRVWAPRLG
ncbi:MAG: glycosyltransferase, partial [Acidimicrobiia bacterium]